MLEIELKSEELKEFIYLQLEKNRREPIYDTDLNKITELDLDRYDLVDDQTDITLEDIVFFKKLKVLYLSNFVLDDKNIRLLNTRKNLDFVQLNDCVFKNIQPLKLGIKHLAIIDSENVELSKYDDLDSIEKLHIVNCKNTNISGISKFKNLSEVYLQNLHLDNVNEVSKMQAIAYLNLNGTKLEDNSIENQNNNFTIEHEKINAYYDDEN